MHTRKENERLISLISITTKMHDQVWFFSEMEVGLTLENQLM